MQQFSDYYMQVAERYPILSREEELKLFKAYHKGDMSARDVLFNSNLKFVLKITHEYYGYTKHRVDFEDLIQHGCIGLFVAIKKFKPSKGVRLISYAVWWIRARINDFIIRNVKLIKFGTTQDDRKLFFKIGTIQKELRNSKEGEKEACREALAAEFGVSLARFKNFEKKMFGKELSLDKPMHGSEDEEGVSFHQLLGIEPDFDVNMTRVEAYRALNSILRILNDRERDVIQRRFVNDNIETLAAIGRSYSISRERVRQIEAAALRKMKNHCHIQGITMEHFIG